MQVIVDEMLRDREARNEQSMAHFADPRLKPDTRTAKDGYLPVIGGQKNLSMAYTPVTNEEYAAFIKATGRKPPKDWTNGAYPAGKGRHPVVNVTYGDAMAYCKMAHPEGRQGEIPPAYRTGVGDRRRAHAGVSPPLALT